MTHLVEYIGHMRDLAVRLKSRVGLLGIVGKMTSSSEAIDCRSSLPEAHVAARKSSTLRTRRIMIALSLNEPAE